MTNSGCAIEKKQPEVVKELEILAASVENLTKNIHDFEGRLQTVLKNPEPQESEKDCAKPEELVPVAEAIRKERKNIQDLNNFLDNVRTRLEI